MQTNVKPRPDGYHTVTPYLVVGDAMPLIEFLKQAFGASEKELFRRPDGSLAHCEMMVGDSVVMIGQASGNWKPMPTMLYIYVDDTDAAYKRALDAGATSQMAPADQYYGDRNAGVQDMCGNSWWIATHIEDVSSEELKRRALAKQP